MTDEMMNVDEDRGSIVSRAMQLNAGRARIFEKRVRDFINSAGSVMREEFCSESIGWGWRRDRM